MRNPILIIWTAIGGILLFVLVMSEIPLYFVYTPTVSGTPPAQIILYRILIDMFICMAIMAFFSGFKHIISERAKNFGWLGTFIFAMAISFVIASLVADSIQAGSLWAAKGSPVNPTWVGYGAEGALLIYGPVNRLLMGSILIASGIVIFKSKMLPTWTAWSACVIAIYNFMFIPTLFFVTTPLDFYSVNGWNIPIAASYFFLWILIVSILLLRKKTITKL